MPMSFAIANIRGGVIRSVFIRRAIVHLRERRFIGTDNPSTIVQAFFAKELTLPLRFGNDGPTTTVAFAADPDDWWYYSNSLFPTPIKFEAFVKKLIK
jgi:hypothetical protein